MGKCASSQIIIGATVNAMICKVDWEIRKVNSYMQPFKFEEWNYQCKSVVHTVPHSPDLVYDIHKKACQLVFFIARHVDLSQACCFFKINLLIIHAHHLRKEDFPYCIIKRVEKDESLSPIKHCGIICISVSSKKKDKLSKWWVHLNQVNCKFHIGFWN